MGITSHALLNKSLLWNLFKEPSKPWSKLIMATYYKHHPPSLNFKCLQRTTTPFWRRILKTLHLIQEITNPILGSGESISLQKDAWLNNEPVGKRLPHLFIAARNPNMLIAKSMNEDNQKIKFSLLLSTQVAAEYEGLNSILQHIDISNKRDNMTWKWFQIQKFSCN